MPYLREVILFLVLAGVLIPLLARLKVNQILGFLAAGFVVGPFGLGAHADAAPWLAHLTFQRAETVEALAELGVTFLMFTIGLELSIDRLNSLRKWVFAVGGAQVVLTALAIGALAYWFGNRIEAAVILGMVLSLSSTAVVMQILTQRRDLATPMGSAVLAVLLLQDLAVVPMLILVNLLGADGSSLAAALLIAAAKGVALIGVIYLVGRRAIRPLFHHLGAGGHAETFMALTLLAVLGTAALTWAAGLSAALGAFLAGVLIAETEYRHEVALTIEPFKGLLMGLFFISVGMGIDLAALLREPLWLPLSVIGLLLLKASIAALVLKLGGLSRSQAVEGGLLLGQGGEFAFIVVGAAMARGELSREVGHFMMLVVGLSLFATPLIARLGRDLAGFVARIFREDRRDHPIAIPPSLARHVLIAGFGRVGQLVASVLEERDIDYLAVDSDAKEVRRWFGRRKVTFGDASRPELLKKLAIDRAAAVVVTMDQSASALHTVRAIRHLAPGVPIVARARDAAHASGLRDAGANLVVLETLEIGLQLAGFALATLGLPDEATTRILGLQRAERIAQFRK